MSVVRKISASIGVIALLMATPVLAAKIKKAPKPPLPPPVLVFSWTGYYVGANAGGVCTNAVANRGVIGNPPLPGVPNGFVDFSDRITLLGQYPNFLGPKCGFIGGAQFGYNYQSSNMVWGIEWDFQGTSLDQTDNRQFPASPILGGFAANSELAGQQLKWLSTLRGRAGFLATPMLLIYGTAGLAFGEVRDVVSTNGIPTPLAPDDVVTSINDNVKWGVAAGGGAEWAFAGPWSAKAEYLYYHLADDTVRSDYRVLSPNGAGTFVDYRFRNEGHIFRLGLNYKFGQ